jgi:hypothetical protein
MILWNKAFGCGEEGTSALCWKRVCSVLDIFITAGSNSSNIMEQMKIDRHDNERADVRLRRQ